METREIWAKVLRVLREKNDQFLLAALSDLQIVFTHDSITITASNPGVFEILKKYQAALDSYAGKEGLIKIRLQQKTPAAKTVEQKLGEIFGDKLEIVVQ